MIYLNLANFMQAVFYSKRMEWLSFQQVLPSLQRTFETLLE